MDYINSLQFDSWGSEFVLTSYWTPFGRHVRFIGEEDGEAALRDDYVVTDAETPKVEPEWESSETGEAPKSYSWAKARNNEEVSRAWEQLQRLTEAAPHLRRTRATETRVRFLEGVLNLFLGWYTSAGFDFLSDHTDPLDTPGVETEPIKREGHRQASYAYAHLDHESTLIGLYRRIKGGSSKGYQAFRQALLRAGFYKSDQHLTPEEKYRAMAARVKAYVDEGRRPDATE